jgi:hypothetical protein
MLENKGNRIIYSGMIYTMHCPINKKGYVPMKGKGILLSHIKREPLVMKKADKDERIKFVF